MQYDGTWSSKLVITHFSTAKHVREEYREYETEYIHLYLWEMHWK